jgi:serine beta-lactamase-like protein LACTB
MVLGINLVVSSAIGLNAYGQVFTAIAPLSAQTTLVSNYTQNDKFPNVTPARDKGFLSVLKVVSVIKSKIISDYAPTAPGLSVAIAYDGKLVWSEGFGFADLDNRKRVTTDTVFRIGSVSKPLTAVGMMMLVEKGKLDLDKDIHDYVPDFPDKGCSITTRQLAGHLGGIRHYKDGEAYLNKHFENVWQGLSIFKDDPLVAEPGEKVSYSSYGYNLISAVMEAAAKRDFLSYMSDAVFKPLRMNNTRSDDASLIIPRCTKYYKVRPRGGFQLEQKVDSSYKWAAGGFLSTPEDLVCFGSALLKPGILGEKSLEQMFTPQKTKSGKTINYGIGWDIGRDKNQHLILRHGGAAIGGTALLVIRPDDKIVFAMTANCTGAKWANSMTIFLNEIFENFDSN